MTGTFDELIESTIREIVDEVVSEMDIDKKVEDAVENLETIVKNEMPNCEKFLQDEWDNFDADGKIEDATDTYFDSSFFNLKLEEAVENYFESKEFKIKLEKVIWDTIIWNLNKPWRWLKNKFHDYKVYLNDKVLIFGDWIATKTWR